MSIFTKLKEKFRHPSAKRLVVAGVFTLALAGSIAAGAAVRGTANAIETRQCGDNSIDNNSTSGGGCGALSPSELITDIKANKPSDLSTLYSTLEGLTPANYSQWANTAQPGYTDNKGNVVVKGQTVMTSAYSYGRQKFNDHRVAQVIGGKTYYHSANQYSFASGVTQIPVMVMFDAKGVATAVVMNPCGNPVKGTPVTPTATCKTLDATKSPSNPNLYTFGATANFSGNAIFSRAVYHFSDGRKDVTTTKLTDTFTATITKDTTVTVTIYATVPGGHEVAAAAVSSCAKFLNYVAPQFSCTSLVPTTSDNQTFRFTINTSQDVHTTVKDADFILDTTNTTAGVTTKDASGHLYKDYTFSDSTSHTVVVNVYFNTLEGVKSDMGHCKATVTPKQKPMCTIPGRTNLPPDSPQCAYCQPGVPVGSAACYCQVPGHTTEAPDSPTCGYCQPGVPIGNSACYCQVPGHTTEDYNSPTCGYCMPGVPIGSSDCTPLPPPPTPPVTPPTQLTNTGPGQTIGLFLGVTIAGFFAHKFFLSRRARREALATVTAA